MNTAETISYDEEWGCYVCQMDLDEDEWCVSSEEMWAPAPTDQSADEYKIVRRQM